MMDGHTFVSYAHEDGAFVRALTTDLRARGLPIWLDTDIPPGADWDRSIDESLRTCVAFVIVLSPAAVSSDEVRGELRTALNLGKHVVPALYEPCDIPRLLQNVQYVDFSMAVDRMSRGHELAAALVSGAQKPRRRDGHDGLAARTLRNRHDYLHDVKSEVAGRLEQSLQPRMLNVPKEKQPEQVTRSWDATVRVANHQRSALPLEAHAVEVFDDETVSGRLLILGAPGGGKTTALLELCQELVARAEADVAEPLPVLCNLSSWRDNGQSIVEWIVDQLKLKYGVRKDNGHQWLADREVVPLLDGLDEVTPEDQERCVQAINQFQDDCRPNSIVVCCRIAEYENYRVKLQLNGAIRLLPLADEQIREYLVNAGCADLWQSISADAESIELARSPLLLRIMTVAYAEMAPADWQRLASASERQARLFDVFIGRLLSDDAGGHYTRARTIRWLTWLGSTMRDHGQAEFLLEQMQPQWLRSRAWLWLYRAGVMMACAAILVGAIYLSQLLFSVVPDGRLSQDFATALNPSGEGWLWQHRNAVLTTMFGVALGLVLASRATIQPIETLVWSRSRAWRGLTGESRRIGLSGLNRVAYVGVLIGLLIGTSSVRDSMAATAVSPELNGWSTAGFVMAFIAVLVLTVTAALTLKPGSWLSGEHGSRWPDGIVSAVVSGAIFGVLGTLTAGPLLGAASGVALATVLACARGSTALSSDRFARALVNGIVASVGIAAITWWIVGFRTGFIGWLDIWLIGCAGVAATAALIAGLHSTRWRNHASRALDVRTWRDYVVMGVVTAVVSGLILGVVGRSYRVVVRGAALMTSRIGLGWVGALSYSLVALSAGAALGIMMGGFLGALYGVLGGLSGPDVERRSRPNQGIRQSARNIVRFAAIGGLIVGLPYGVVNILAATALTRVVPNLLDWISLAVYPALVFGFLGGLVPGAACIQHFTLRFVLASSGRAPWRYARFLNYATERMLLQRVGGRYRFIHALLRDHFAVMQGADGQVPRGAADD